MVPDATPVRPSATFQPACPVHERRWVRPRRRTGAGREAHRRARRSEVGDLDLLIGTCACPTSTRAVLHGGDPGGCVVAQVRAVRAAEGCGVAPPWSTTQARTSASRGSPSGRAPEAKAPPGHATLTGCSRARGDPRRPGPPPARTPTAHQRGTPQPHSVPPLCDQPLGHGAGPVTGTHDPDRQRPRQVQVREELRHGRVPLGLQLGEGVLDGAQQVHRAHAPVRVEPWVARPSIEIRKVSEPPLAGTTAPSVGSAMTQADARCPRRRVAKAPSPPSSSALTACTASGRAGFPRCGDGADCTEHRGEPTLHVAGAAAMAVPSSTRSSYGPATGHCDRSPGGTTSVCPHKASAGTRPPSPRPQGWPGRPAHPRSRGPGRARPPCPGSRRRAARRRRRWPTRRRPAQLAQPSRAPLLDGRLGRRAADRGNAHELAQVARMPRSSMACRTRTSRSVRSPSTWPDRSLAATSAAGVSLCMARGSHPHAPGDTVRA